MGSLPIHGPLPSTSPLIPLRLTSTSPVDQHASRLKRSPPTATPSSDPSKLPWDGGYLANLCTSDAFPVRLTGCVPQAQDQDESSAPRPDSKANSLSAEAKRASAATMDAGPPRQQPTTPPGRNRPTALRPCPPTHCRLALTTCRCYPAGSSWGLGPRGRRRARGPGEGSPTALRGSSRG